MLVIVKQKIALSPIQLFREIMGIGKIISKLTRHLNGDGGRIDPASLCKIWFWFFPTQTSCAIWWVYFSEKKSRKRLQVAVLSQNDKICDFLRNSKIVSMSSLEIEEDALQIWSEYCQKHWGFCPLKLTKQGAAPIFFFDCMHCGHGKQALLSTSHGTSGPGEVNQHHTFLPVVVFEVVKQRYIQLTRKAFL